MPKEVCRTGSRRGGAGPLVTALGSYRRCPLALHSAFFILHSVIRRAAAATSALAGVILLLSTVAASSGCTNAYYQRFQIGQSPEAYDRILPAANMRRTDLGLCFLNRDALGGRTDAMVVLVTPDRRVAAKFQAVHTERRVPGLVSESGYRLVGEIDPQLCDVLATGPIDALRLITSRIVAYQGERLALDAHAWVAGGLVRLLDAWPTVRALPADDRRVSELLERVPGGGEAAIRIDARGRWTVTYEQGVMR